MDLETWNAAAPSQLLSYAELNHRQCAELSARCARDVLPFFEHVFPQDNRPRRAVETAELWLTNGREVDLWYLQLAAEGCTQVAIRNVDFPECVPHFGQAASLAAVVAELAVLVPTHWYPEDISTARALTQRAVVTALEAVELMHAQDPSRFSNMCREYSDSIREMVPVSTIRLHIIVDGNGVDIPCFGWRRGDGAFRILGTNPILQSITMEGKGEVFSSNELVPLTPTLEFLP